GKECSNPDNARGNARQQRLVRANGKGRDGADNDEEQQERQHLAAAGQRQSQIAPEDAQEPAHEAAPSINVLRRATGMSSWVAMTARPPAAMCSAKRSATSACPSVSSAARGSSSNQ